MKTRLLITTFLFLLGHTCPGQKVPTISDIDFSLINNKLVIKYNIDNYKHTDKYNLKVEIFKASGEKINAMSFTSDLKQVQSGENNSIVWDIERDNIELDDDIYVVISGEVITEGDADKTMETPFVITPPVSDAKSKIQPVSRTACFFKSLAFPGWGTSDITLKKGHLVKGVAGYGAIIGSVIMANMSNDSYDSYKSATDPVTRENYYESASNKSTFSYILAGAAATIWTVDLVTVLSVKNKTIGKPSAGISLNMGYSFASNEAHLITCKFRF